MLIQIILLVLWYTVPAMAAIPAFVIFLPLIFIGAILALVILGFGAVSIGAAFAGR